MTRHFRGSLTKGWTGFPAGCWGCASFPNTGTYLVHDCVTDSSFEPASPRENARSRRSFHFAAAGGTHRHRGSGRGAAKGVGPWDLPAALGGGFGRCKRDIAHPRRSQFCSSIRAGFGHTPVVARSCMIQPRGGPKHPEDQCRKNQEQKQFGQPVSVDESRSQNCDCYVGQREAKQNGPDSVSIGTGNLGAPSSPHSR